MEILKMLSVYYGGMILLGLLLLVMVVSGYAFFCAANKRCKTMHRLRAALQEQDSEDRLNAALRLRLEERENSPSNVVEYKTRNTL